MAARWMLLILLIVQPLASAAADVPVVKLGDRTVRLPAPEGYVSVHTDERFEAELRETETEGTPLKFLAGYVTGRDAALYAKGKDPAYATYAKATMLATGATLHISQGDFTTLAAQHKNAIKKMPRVLSAKAKSNRIITFMLEEEKNYLVRELAGAERHFGVIMLTKYIVDEVRLTSMVTMLVKNRIINVYVHSLYKEPEDVQRLEAATLDWIKRIEAANHR